MHIARVLWARRVIVATATFGSLFGGMEVAFTAPRQYDATAKVELEIVGRDPVTGFALTGKNVEAYVSSQVQLIRDYQVGVRVAQGLGWLDSPDLQDMYAARAPSGGDFEHWVAQRVTAATSVSLIDGSNILQIKYRAISPEAARAVAEQIRQAYIEAVTAGKRAQAAAAGERLSQAADKIRVNLATMEANKNAMERQTGIVLQDRDPDVDTARLSAYAANPYVPQEARPVTGSTESAEQLAQVESMLASAGKQLGPNNPSLIALRQRRDLLASRVAMERTSVAALAGQTNADRARLTDANLRAQMDKVVAQRPDRTRLLLLQDQIDKQSERYRKTMQAAQEQRQLANVGDGGVNAVGLAESSGKPAYPNKALILGGSGILGFGLGVLGALLIELLGRRVRYAHDLKLALPGANLATLPTLRLQTAAGRTPRLLQILRREKALQT